MRIKVNVKIFAFAILFYLTKQIKFYAMFMIFALVHELAHLFCGVLLGLKPKTLRIMPLGLCVEFETEARRTNQLAIKKIIIALAGPLANLLISIILCMTKPEMTDLIYCNFLIAIFNLLPIYPLDGGRIIKNILKLHLEKRKVLEITYILSNITVIVITAISSIAIYYYKNIAILFIVIYLWGLLLRENKRYKILNRTYKIMEKSRFGDASSATKLSH